MVQLVKFPQSKDGGMMEIHFTDPSLALASADRTPVSMKFDSGTIDGYEIQKDTAADQTNTYLIGMTTYLLKNIISVMAKASSLTVMAGEKSTSFNLAPGFGDAIASMRQCAEDYAGQT